MEIDISTIATMVGMGGTILFVLHRSRSDREKLVEWRAKIESRVESNEKEQAKVDERLKRHGEENDKLMSLVQGVKKDLEVFKAEYEKDMGFLKEQLTKLNGNG